MKYDLGFEQNDSFAIFKVSGQPELAGFQELLDDFLNNPVWQSVKKIMLDFSELHIGNVESDEVRQFINTQKATFKKLNKIPIAVVVSCPVDFGVVRMCGTLAEKMITCYQVFYTTEDALEWLGPERTIPSTLKILLSVAI